MYVLELLIAGHRDFMEHGHMLSQLIDPSGTDRAFVNGVVKLADFFEKEVCRHMELEEKVVYPVMKQALPADKMHIIHEMEAEHKTILGKLKAFGDLANGMQTTSGMEKRKNLVDLCKEILHITAPHMRREYEILPPLINAFFKSGDYKNVEELYLKFNH